MMVSSTPVAITASCATSTGQARRTVLRAMPERLEVTECPCCQNTDFRVVQAGRSVMHEETNIVHSGLHPERHQGAVNPPVFHASTILSESVAEYRRKRRDFQQEIPGTYYGRFGTPTLETRQEAIAALEGGHRT